MASTNAGWPIPQTLGSSSRSLAAWPLASWPSGLSSAVNLEKGLTHTSRKDKKPLKRIIYLIMSVAAVLGLGMAAATAASASAKNPAHLAAADESTLWDGQSLSGGQSLVNGSYTLAMQTDGNLVLYYGSSQALWQSHTYDDSGAWVAMQGDGNLVVYAPGNVPLWQSGTVGNTGARLVMQADGNAVVYSTTNWPLWYTNTAGQGGNARGVAAVNSEIANASSRNWNNLCETAVENAYGTDGQFGTALLDYQWMRDHGHIHAGDRNAPRGALVFFNGADPTTGHVGLAAGDGTNYYTTDGGTIHLAPLSEGGIVYYGWSWAPPTANWRGSWVG